MKVSDEKIVAAVLSCRTHAEAAKQLQLSERYYYSRLKSESVQERLREAQQKLLDESISEMRKHLTEATDTMVNIMLNPENAPQIRLNAASALQSSFLRFTEREDIIRRLEKLENLL